MSRHGSPGGRYEPQQPGPDDYGPPSDPWSAAPPPDSWGDLTAPQSGYPGQGYPEHMYQSTAAYHQQGAHPAPYPEPYPEPPRRRNVGLYATITVLVVLAAVGVGYALYLLSGEDADPRAGGDPTPTATSAASPGPSGTPVDNIGMNAAMARVDDCLVNDGDSGQPQMRIVACDADQEGPVFQVLAIFDERIAGQGEAANEQAQSVCAGTEGYKYHYYEVSDSASFVLCMAERTEEG